MPEKRFTGMKKQEQHREDLLVGLIVSPQRDKTEIAQDLFIYKWSNCTKSAVGCSLNFISTYKIDFEKLSKIWKKFGAPMANGGVG